MRNNEPIGMDIAERFDFTPHRCVLDVAGASGGMVISIAKGYQQLRAIVMDLPPICKLRSVREYMAVGREVAQRAARRKCESTFLSASRLGSSDFGEPA